MSDICVRNIGLVLEMTRAWGREVLPGIAEYSRHRCHWNLALLDWASTTVPPISGYIGALTFKDSSFDSGPKREHIPVVNISAARPPPNIPLVTHDNLAVGRLAAEHLLEMGVTRFACASMPDNNLSNERRNGFEAALGAAGFPLPPSFNEVEISGILRVWKQGRGPLGVFAVTDRRARHVVSNASASGLSIPSEIVLVGCDNDPVECELSTIPLSSIALDYAAVGYRAAEMLDALLQGQSVPAEVRVKPLGVVRRRSSDFLHVEDPMIRRVLSILRMQYAETLRTVDLAKTQGLTPRHLQRRFKSATGKTLQAELLRLRLERARDLLINSPLSISEVALQCGFTDFTRFPLYFRRRFGHTPREYRSRMAAQRG
jgi:LacI family transcriptional regulator